MAHRERNHATSARRARHRRTGRGGVQPGSHDGPRSQAARGGRARESRRQRATGAGGCRGARGDQRGRAVRRPAAEPAGQGQARRLGDRRGGRLLHRDGAGLLRRGGAGRRVHPLPARRRHDPAAGDRRAAPRRPRARQQPVQRRRARDRAEDHQPQLAGHAQRSGLGAQRAQGPGRQWPVPRAQGPEGHVARPQHAGQQRPALRGAGAGLGRAHGRRRQLAAGAGAGHERRVRQPRDRRRLAL